MALYSPQRAKLGELDGTGYMFRNRSARGMQVKGVFFGPDGSAESLQAHVDGEPIAFEGVMYKKSLAGVISSDTVEMTVRVKTLRTVSMGEKATLVAVED